MQQILFRLPIIDLPIYGYGMMLFLAYFFCTWLGSWLAKKQGIPSQAIYDLSLWLFICGILGARITFMIQYHDNVPLSFWNFISLWDGGLIFYGSAIGGVVGYFGAYYFVLRKHKISTWQMADVIAPCAALGLCLGRVGCLLNGCCYGNVACDVAFPALQAESFPLPAFPRFEMVRKGYQTAAGFTLSDERLGQVGKVEPNSPAARAGLREGDDIWLEVDGMKKDVSSYLGDHRAWPRGKNDLILKVRRANGDVEDIGPIVPWTIGLHRTQVYESISMAILFFLLLAYFPYRRRAGAVMVLYMVCYAAHRFLNEILRVDTEPVAFDMTLSQNISIIVFAAGVLLGLWLWLTGQDLGASARQSAQAT
jgi:phosphatidylglycerol:prolipoprotein diacylglycerol transferase